MSKSMTTDVPSAEVLERFGLSVDAGWRLEHLRTLNNSVFGITQGDQDPQWVLRQHRQGWRDDAAIATELDLLSYLTEHLPDGIVVPTPKRAIDGEKLITVAGRHFSMLSWIPGTVRRPDNGLDRDATYLLGRGLGAIHTATDADEALQVPIEWNATTLFSDNPSLLGVDPAGLDRLLSPEDRALFELVADRSGEIFERQEDWGIIHGDYILGNCHWNGSAGHLQLGILDFDDFGFGPRLFDLGAVLGNLADYPDCWPDAVPAFLAGYRSAHQLADVFVPDLPMMMAARHMSHCLWAIGHLELGQDWVSDHVRARIAMARECLSVSL